MMISTILATDRYDFNAFGTSFQYRYRNDIPTNLPNSKALAITIADTAAPANKVPIPVTENNAAHPAITKAVNETSVLKLKNLLIYSPKKTSRTSKEPVRPVIFLVYLLNLKGFYQT
jgi:hypothetical protein